MGKEKDDKVINIVLPEYPFGVKQGKRDNRDIYRVHDDVLEQNIAICNAKVSSIEEVEEILDKYNKKIDSLFHTFYFLILFGRIAHKDGKYNSIMLSLDKEKNQIKKLYENLKKKYDDYRKNPTNDLDNLLEESEYFVNYQKSLDKKLTDTQKKYYSKMKMPTYSACDGKTYLEVYALSQGVNEMIDEFKSVKEAGEYFIYNSGDLIVDTVNALVTSISNMGNTAFKKEFSFSYFLKENFVLVMEYREWITLFSKIKQALKRIIRIEAFDNIKFKTLYEELEKRYIVVLMYNELEEVK